MIESRIGWAASSNASFRGASDWEPAGEGETADDVEQSLYEGKMMLTAGLEIALECSGFEWWVETREAGEEG